MAQIRIGSFFELASCFDVKLEVKYFDVIGFGLATRCEQFCASKPSGVIDVRCSLLASRLASIAVNPWLWVAASEREAFLPVN